MDKLIVVGAGPGNPGGMTGEAVELVRRCGRVYAAPRLARALSGINPHIISAQPEDIKQELRSVGGDCAVLVSGDTGFFSLAKVLAREFAEQYEISMMPGISSFQLLFARLNKGYEDAKIVSVHGRGGHVAGPAAYHRAVFYLTGGKGSARRVFEELEAAGLGELPAAVGENLCGPDEVLRLGTVADMAREDIGPLSVLLVENPAPANPSRRLRDDDFLRGEVPMTKEPVRVLAVSRLAVAPGDVVYDIGGGSGSVSVALAHAARDGRVYAVERNPAALALMAENRRRLGAYNMDVVPGDAPAALAALPAPDKVFIGGSGGAMGEIVACVKDKGNPFTLCISAITLESLGEGVSLLETGGFADVEITCVGASHAKRLGDYHLMQSQNQVYLLSGRWPG